MTMETDPVVRRAGLAAPVAGASVALGERLGKALELATSDATSGRATDFAELNASAARINEVMRAYGLEFTVSDTGSRIVTRIIDRESGEVIRQIPEEAVLRAAERLDDMVGILLRDRV